MIAADKQHVVNGSLRDVFGSNDADTAKTTTVFLRVKFAGLTFFFGFPFGSFGYRIYR